MPLLVESVSPLTQPHSPVSPLSLSLSVSHILSLLVFLSAVSPEGGVSITPDNTTLDDSDSVTLNCTTEGGPANTFQWSFDGEELENETLSNLTLSSVIAEDGGAYTCSVTNPAGSGSFTAYVFISPMITLNPVNMSVVNGTDEVTFTCNATGFPEPSFEWFREGSSALLSNTISLTIAPVTFGDEGFYFCEATSNDLMVESQRATLSSKPHSDHLCL